MYYNYSTHVNAKYHKTGLRMNEFRKLLVDISTEGDNEQFNRLIHLVKGQEEEEGQIHIPAGVLERYSSTMDIFNHMVQMDFISPNKMDNLKDIITTIFKHSPSKSKVEGYLKDYEGRISGNVRNSTEAVGISSTVRPHLFSQPATSQSEEFGISGISSFRTDKQGRVPKRFEDAFKYAAGKIGEDWNVFARLANVDQSTVRSIQNYHPQDVYLQALSIFTHWYAIQANPSLTIFRKTLRNIPRNDIADALRTNEKQKNDV